MFDLLRLYDMLNLCLSKLERLVQRRARLTFNVTHIYNRLIITTSIHAREEANTSSQSTFYLQNMHTLLNLLSTSRQIKQPPIINLDATQQTHAQLFSSKHGDRTTPLTIEPEV